MYKATKNKFLQLTIYLLFFFGASYWIQNELQETVKQVMTQTSELVAQEVQSALYEPASNYLSDGIDNGNMLEKTIIATIEHSEAMVYLDIINRKGKVLKSSNVARIGMASTIPKTLMVNGDSPKLFNEFTSITDGEVRTLWTPIRVKGTNVGFLRFGIRGRDVGKSFAPLYYTVLYILLLGFLLMFAMDLIQHHVISKLGVEISGLLRAAAKGEEIPDGKQNDEFFHIRQSAKELGLEISHSRSKVELLSREFSTITNRLKVGLLQVDSTNNVNFVNDQAKSYLAKNLEIATYLEGLEQAMEHLRPAIEQLRNSSKLSLSLSFGIQEQGWHKNFIADLFQLETDNWQGCFVLLHDQELIDALNDDLKNAARARSLSITLLGAIHDIKAPLTAMLMNLELLSESVAPTGNEIEQVNNPKAKANLRYLAILRSELDRLDKLLGGLYAQTILDDKVKTNYSLVTILEDLVSLLKAQASSQKVSIKFKKPEKEVIISGISGELKQALLNIMLNGLEAMENGGVLTINLGSVDEKTQLSICDSGPGIPEYLKEKIFEMHFSTKETGTGIGLYVSRRIIEKNGGQLTVNSQVGKGTCFEIVM